MGGKSRDLLAGGIFLAIGSFFVIGSLVDLEVGTARRMGPGYFPTFVGYILCFLSVCILLSAKDDRIAFGTVPWRGLILIGAAPVFFGLCIRGLGFVPTVAATILISTFAQPRIGSWHVLGVVVVLTLICMAIFVYGLEIPLRMIGPWLEWAAL